MTEIRQQAVVTAAWMLTGSVTLPNTELVNGMQFFKVVKADARIHRLLIGSCRKNHSKTMSDTTIVRTLTELRNAKRLELLQSFAASADDELDLDVGKDKFKPFEPMLPPVIDIIAPTISDNEAQTIKVLCQAASLPLWVQLTVANVTYLHHAICGAVEDQPAKKQRVHVFNDDKRSAFRVRYLEADTFKTKDFRFDGTDEGRAVAEHEANEFAKAIV